MKKIKAGIIGMGFIGRQHVEAIRRVPNTEIVALCEHDLAKARAAAEELGIPHYYTDIDELLEHHKDLDVIHNCTPSGLHYELNKKIIQAGINVYCEKPFTVNAKESAELVELLEKSGLKGGVNFNYRHNLMVMEMKEKVANRSVGKPWFVTADYLQDWMLRQTDYDWRVDPQLGGATRAISDIGSHCFDTLQYILGDRIINVEAKRFNKFSTRIHNGTEVPVNNEDAAIIHLEFASGMQGLIRISQVTAGKKNDFHILLEGEEQSLEWYQERPDRLWIGNRDSGNEELYADKKYLLGEAANSAILPNGHSVGWADAFKQGVLSFYDLLRGNTDSSYVSFEDAHYLMQVVDACLMSDLEHRKVKVASQEKKKIRV